MSDAATRARSPASAPLATTFLSTLSVIPLRTTGAAGSFQAGIRLLPRPPGRPARLGDGSAPQPVGRSVPRKQLPGEIRAREPALSAHDVVQRPVAVAGRLRTLEVEARADDAGAAAVHERDRTVVFDRLHDAHVGEAVVAASVAIAVVRISEKHEISRPRRSFAQGAVLAGADVH